MISSVHRKRASTLPGAALLLLLPLVLGLPTLLYPYGRDQAMFAYVGAVWRMGGLPYRDAWDVKLPGIYAIYAWVGSVEWGPRLLDLAASAVTMGALVWIGRMVPPGNRHNGAELGKMAAVLACVFTLGAFDFWNLAQTETLIAPLSAWAVALGLARRPFAAGLIVGLAALIKTTAALAVLPVWLCCCLVAVRREEMHPAVPRAEPGGLIRCLVPAVVGWLLPAFLVMAYFAAQGEWRALVELVSTQREYAGGDPRLAGHSLRGLIAALGLTGYLPLILVSILGVGCTLFRLRSVTEPQRITANTVLLAWWGVALLQVVVQRRFYLYHWAVLTPAAAWFAAVALSTFRGAQPVGRARRVGAILICVAMAVFATAPRWSTWQWAAAVLMGHMSLAEYRARHTGVFGYDVRFARQAAEHVRQRSTPGDALLVLAFEPEVYLYSGRFAPTRHASEAPLFGETSITEVRRRAWFAELMADLERSPPLYLIDRDVPHVRPGWSAPLQELIATGYRWEAEYGPFRVYRRWKPRN